MPVCENYKNPNPYATPEPHFKPGYTGWLPGFGPHKQFLAPRTYEVVTHEIMVPHPIAGRRLNNILEMPKDVIRKRYDEEYFLEQHIRHATDLKRRENTVSGYAGHIPRIRYSIGSNFPKSVRESTAEFVSLKDPYMM